MATRALSDLTWEETRDLMARRVVAVLPVGAVEAHGPHLPLVTDIIIADAMARAGAARLERRGVPAMVMPPLAYTPAPFAAGVPGTISLREETTTAILTDLAASLARHGVTILALANAHLDPTNIGALSAAAGAAREAAAIRIVFPDITRAPWASRLTPEFKSGACHAGRYESSIILATRPDLVRDTTRRTLPPNPTSLSAAIREGKTTFEQAGGPAAYFGYPADASVKEGETTIAVLGSILEEAVLEELGDAA